MGGCLEAGLHWVGVGCVGSWEELGDRGGTVLGELWRGGAATLLRLVLLLLLRVCWVGARAAFGWEGNG